MACKKDHHEDPPPPLAPRIKTVTAGTDLRTYTYDSKGRVTEIVYKLYGKDDFTYTDTSVTRKFYDTTEKLTGTTIYKLNAKGQVISFTSDGGFNDVITQTYTSDGELLTSNTTRTLTAQPVRHWDNTYYYTNKNLDSMQTAFDDGSSITIRKDYYDEYFTDKISTIGNDNYGQAWLGLSSKNLIKAARDIGSDNTGYQPQTTYEYEYDSLNRVAKQTQFWGTSAFTPISFTYY